MWNGKPQSMNFSLGVPKGMRRVLEEREIDTKGMKAEDFCLILGIILISKVRNLLSSAS